MEVLRTTPADAEDVIRFLCSVFRMSPSAPFVSPDLIRWKYYDDLPGFEGSRSFALVEGRDILAHVGIVPARFVSAGKEVSSAQFIDLAASPDVPGSGHLLCLEVEKLTRTRIGIGGTQASRSLVSRVMKSYGSLDTFARIVRPFAQFRNHPERNWKKPLRLARNTAWMLTPLPAVSMDWRATPVARFEEAQVGRFPGTHRKFTPFKRTAAELNFLLRCPAGRMSGFLLEQNACARGYFILSQAGPQARIAGLYIDSDERDDWMQAYRHAFSAAAGLPGVHEVAAAAATDLERTAIVANGFRLREREPVWLRDPEGCFTGEPCLQITLLEGDGAYRYTPEYPYLT